MKLSEAIRLGAMLKPQGFCEASSKPMIGDAVCALGAASDALGHPNDELERYQALATLYPFLVKRPDSYSACDCNHMKTWSAMNIVWHLNDIHRWTRERIADWVATIEPQETAHDLQPLADQDLLNLSHSQATVAGGMDK